MNNKKVAEIYAESEKEAKTNNLFINGKDIYSYGYHFKIAHKESKNLVLFNWLGYSQTTAKHKSFVLRALLNKGFDVLFIINAEATEKNIKAQLNKNNKEIETLLIKKTKTERTTQIKKERINFLREQNILIKNLSI